MELSLEETIKFVETLLNNFNYQEEQRKIKIKYRKQLTGLLKKCRNERDKVLLQIQLNKNDLTNKLNTIVEKSDNLTDKESTIIIEDYRIKLTKLVNEEEKIKREWETKIYNTIKQNNLNLENELTLLNNKYNHLIELKERIEDSFKISCEEWEEYISNNDKYSLQQLSIPSIGYENGKKVLKCHNIKIIVPNYIVNYMPNYFGTTFDIKDYYDLFMLDFEEEEILPRGEFIDRVIKSLLKDKEAIMVEDLLYKLEKSKLKDGSKPIEPTNDKVTSLASFNIIGDSIKFQLNTPLFNDIIIKIAKLHYNKELNKKSKLLN